MFDPIHLCCSSLTTAVGGTKDINIVDSESPYRGTNQNGAVAGDGAKLRMMIISVLVILITSVGDLLNPF